FRVTSAVTPFNFFNIHLSAALKLTWHKGFIFLPLAFILTYLEAFLILFMKVLELSILSSLKRISPPGATPVDNEKRRLSAPYFSINSMGSTPLPRDFNIFLPKES